MDKRKLIQKICEQLEEHLASAKVAALATYEAATGDESRPENQYDTRALEASYLAGAQAKRVLEIETALNAYKYLEVKQFDKNTPIGPSALIHLDLNGKTSWIFLVPAGGGMSIQFEGKPIQILTPKSPLGEALDGLKVGESAFVDKGNDTLEYEVLSVS